MGELRVGGRQLERGGHGGFGVAQRLQDAAACTAIGISPAQTLLFNANGAAGGVANHAVGAADGVAACEQQCLQFAALAPA